MLVTANLYKIIGISRAEKNMSRNVKNNLVNEYPKKKVDDESLLLPNVF